MRVSCALAAATSCALALSAQGQSDLARFQRQLDQLRRDTLLRAPEAMPAGQRVLVDYGGYFIFDYISLDDEFNDNHGLRQYNLMAFAHVNFDGAHEFFLRGWGIYEDYNPGDSFDGKGDEWVDPDLDRAYYRFDLARHLAAYKGQELGANVVVTAGRDFAYWGNGLVLAEVLDGGMIRATFDFLTLDVVAGVTPKHTVDFDSSRPDFDTDTHRGFYGGMLTATLGSHRPYIYALMQEDYNDDEVMEVGSISTGYHYDSYYLGFGMSGSLTDRLIYSAEVAFEGGKSLSNSFKVEGPFLTPVDQTRDSIDAYAVDLRIDYLVGDVGSTRLSGEFLAASGDDDRLRTSNTFGGNLTGTDDQAFNAFGLVNTGLAFAPSVSNIMAFRLGGSTLLPIEDSGHVRRMQLGCDVFFFMKQDEDAPIDEATMDHRFLGWEPDVFLNWQIFSDVTLSVRYGVFFPNDKAFASDKLRQFFSVGFAFAL